MLVNACKDKHPSTFELYICYEIGNQGRDYSYCRLLRWRELGLRLVILHAHLKGWLVVTVLSIVTWVPGPDLLASIEKGKDLCSVDTVVYLHSVLPTKFEGILALAWHSLPAVWVDRDGGVHTFGRNVLFHNFFFHIQMYTYIMTLQYKKEKKSWSKKSLNRNIHSVIPPTRPDITSLFVWKFTWWGALNSYSH